MKKAAAGIFIFFILGLLFCSSLSGQDMRHALVIGNSAYKSSPLQNPMNDAIDISAALQQMGFEVSTALNADRMEMEGAIREFEKKIDETSPTAALFYFAGHGMQIQGTNYLIPIQADIRNEEEVRYKAVDVGFLLSKMEDSNSKVNIIILDACRDNPFKRSFRSSSRGLSVVEAPAESLIVYATAPGKVAADGEGRNGVFTEEFLRHVFTPGLEVESLLKSVRKGVIEKTKGQQIPWSSSSLTTNFYFITSEAVGEALENEEGGQVEKSGGFSPTFLGTGILKFNLPGNVTAVVKNGYYSREINGEGIVKEIPVGEYEVIIQWDATITENKKILIEKNKTSELYSLKKGLTFVEKGKFILGSDNGNDDEKPSHQVIVPNSFFISTYEITNEQVVTVFNWALFKKKIVVINGKIRNSSGKRVDLLSIGSSDSNLDLEYGMLVVHEEKKDFPCTGITWYGAVAFCNFLSEIEGYEELVDFETWECDFSLTGYRLPTEVEWEYAAKGGHSAKNQTDIDDSDLDGEVWFIQNSARSLHPVGLKEPNRLGLYDIQGNVSEWCWNWYDKTAYKNIGSYPYSGPADGTKRTFRGGNIYQSAQGCRIEKRNALDPLRSRQEVGFRIVLAK